VTQTPAGDRPVVSVLTLGCKLNQSDSETIARRLAGEGVRVVDRPVRGASAFVINSCSVTHVADRKARHLAAAEHLASSIGEAVEIGRRQGVPAPCAAQLPYSLVQRSPVEDPEMLTALAAAGAGVVASYVMAGGVLTGKYTRPGKSGRMAGHLHDDRVQPALPAGEKLRALAESWGASPGPLAIAFALQNTAVTSVLFGATSPEQVAQNCAALDLLQRLDADQRTALAAIGRAGN